MAGYQGAEAYVFSLFEAKDMTEAVAEEAAVQLPAQKQKSKNPNLQVVPKRTRQQEKMQALAGFKRALFALFVSVVLFGAIVMQITSSVRSDTLERKIENINAEMQVAKSENVRLASAIDGMFSIANVEDFATNVLGMAKLEDYQIEYVDLSAEDKVLYSGAPKAADEGFFSSVKAYFTELFA